VDGEKKTSGLADSRGLAGGRGRSFLQLIWFSCEEMVRREGGTCLQRAGVTMRVDINHAVCLSLPPFMPLCSSCCLGVVGVVCVIVPNPDPWVRRC